MARDSLSRHARGLGGVAPARAVYDVGMLHSALPPAEDLNLVTLADIARGGMGIVQLARVVGGRLHGRTVAVKRLSPQIEEDQESTNMFLDETWITSRIASPNVVKVEAWGRDGAGLYLAVELVQGVSLSRLITETKEKQEAFAERTVAFIASQLCDGLAAAHALTNEGGTVLGLVHRDLTPGNILLGFDGIVKIADFGIAKAEQRLTSTQIGMMKGKPAYMAPEQARGGGGLDGRADLFALGVVMFELLSGRKPWLGANDLEVLIAVSTTEPPDLAELRSNLSPVFVEIVRRCLKKRPSDRFSSAGEIKALLDGWRAERGFDRDDVASFAAFVQRNTPEQQLWFREALDGQLGQGGLTFMDIEARIDQARKGPAKPNETVKREAPRPAAGAPVARPMSSPAATVLMDTPPTVDDVDDAAATQFMGKSPLHGMSFSPAPRPPKSSKGGYATSMARTVGLSPEEVAALAARLPEGVDFDSDTLPRGVPPAASAAVTAQPASAPSSGAAPWQTPGQAPPGASASPFKPASPIVGGWAGAPSAADTWGAAGSHPEARAWPGGGDHPVTPPAAGPAPISGAWRLNPTAADTWGAPGSHPSAREFPASRPRRRKLALWIAVGLVFAAALGFSVYAIVLPRLSGLH